MASDTTHSTRQHRGLPASPACLHATHRRLAAIHLALRGIEADRAMPNTELRMTSRVSRTSTFELQPSNFAPALPGQFFYSTQIPVSL